MTQRINELGQPIGDEVAGWTGVDWPSRTSMEGRFCRIEPLATEHHLSDLFEAYSDDADGKLWTYMVDGPFRSIDDLRKWMEPASASDDPFFHAVVDLATGKAVGMAAYMRIKPQIGVIEVGSISYSTRLQRTPMATEVMFLMMRRVFNELGYRRYEWKCDSLNAASRRALICSRHIQMMRRVFNELGYRRYEWKCDSLNAASRRAAERLGFTFDGLFGQAIVYKGRNRDTAWYSILDCDWPPIEKAYVNWLNAANFDEDGQQKRKLQELIAAEQEGFK